MRGSWLNCGRWRTSVSSPVRLTVVLLAVGALLASCGGDDAPASAPATSAVTEPAPSGGDGAPTDEPVSSGTEAAPSSGEAAREEATSTVPAATAGEEAAGDDESTADDGATAAAGDDAAAAEPASPTGDEAAPSEPAAPEPAPGRAGTLTFGLVGAPPSLNPGIGDPAFNSVYMWAYDSLVILQPDGVFAPNLATEFGYTDDGNMRYELILRPDVRFSDGTALDAEAVKAHLDYVRSQPTALAQNLARVTDVEVTGPLSLVIHLGESDPGLTFAFAQGFGVGNVISPAALASPETLDFGTAGAGPYVLVPEESVPQDTYTYVPNPHYWNPERIHWDEVVLRVIPNSSSMIEAMRAGQVQAGHGDPGTIAAAREAGLTVTGAQNNMVGLNLVDRNGEVSAALGDVRVRRALNHAVNRAAIAEALLGDAEFALSQYAIEGHRGYSTALEAANAYDPDLARRLLAEAGYGDGVTIPALTVSLLGLDTVVQAIGGQLAEVGVTLDITTVPDPNSYFTGMLSREYPTVVITYGLANMQTLHVGYIDPQGPFNPFGVVDEELAALYAEYFATVGDTSDVEQRINARLVDQAWALPVMGAPLVWYLVEGLTGIEATGGNSSVPTFVDIRPE